MNIRVSLRRRTFPPAIKQAEIQRTIVGNHILPGPVIAGNIDQPTPIAQPEPKIPMPAPGAACRKQNDHVGTHSSANDAQNTCLHKILPLIRSGAKHPPHRNTVRTEHQPGMHLQSTASHQKPDQQKQRNHPPGTPSHPGNACHNSQTYASSQKSPAKKPMQRIR